MMITKTLKSNNNAVKAAHKDQSASTASPNLLNGSQEKCGSHNKSVEIEYMTSAACITQAGNQHNYTTMDQHVACVNHELVACLLESQANPYTRLENVDNYTNCSSLAAYLKKVNAASFSDHQKLQQTIISDDICLQPLSLWELTA